MTLMEFRRRQQRRTRVLLRYIGAAGLVLAALLAIMAVISAKGAAASDSAPTPALQQQMLAQLQDVMAMKQNTAVWTSQGLVVLQGNRLLLYSPDLVLQHMVTLPVPQAPAVVTPAIPTNATAPGDMALEALPPLRSRLVVRIVPAAGGLIVVRGLQLFSLDSNFKVVGQATLPDLPPLTLAELAAVCPQIQPMAPGDGAETEGAGMSGVQMMGARTAMEHHAPNR